MGDTRRAPDEMFAERLIDLSASSAPWPEEVSPFGLVRVGGEAYEAVALAGGGDGGEIVITAVLFEASAAVAARAGGGRTEAALGWVRVDVRRT